MNRGTLTIKEAALELGVSKALVYESAKRGEIPTIRLGRRILVPRNAFERLVAGEAATAGA